MSGPAERRTVKASSSDGVVEVCAVRLGASLYGVPIRHILEIVGAVQPQPVPLAPGFVGGLVHYRGDVLSTVSLRHVLGLPAHAGAQAVLVLESPWGAFGLLVDSVSDVITVAEGDVEPNPSTISDGRKGLFAGACKLEDSLLILLDPARLDPAVLGATGAA